MRPADEPSVIAAGAELVARLGRPGRTARRRRPTRSAGRASVFIGQIHCGEIYNQYPQECRLEGTRRWLPGTDRRRGRARVPRARRRARRATRARPIDLRCISSSATPSSSTRTHPLVAAFQDAYEAIAGRPLPLGPKPFVDDGNSFWALAGVPAITHGPRAGGQHTVEEWVSIDDLVRVAHLYASTAILYCPQD